MVLCLVVVRMQTQGRFIMRYGFINPAAFYRKHGSVVLGDVVIGVNLERVLPERLGISPIGSLHPRPPGQSADDDGGSGGGTVARLLRKGSQVSRHPSASDVQSNVR